MKNASLAVISVAASDFEAAAGVAEERKFLRERGAICVVVVILSEAKVKGRGVDGLKVHYCHSLPFPFDKPLWA